jgi:uncharacterized protein (UPF0147 family)
MAEMKIELKITDLPEFEKFLEIIKEMLDDKNIPSDIRSYYIKQINEFIPLD